MARYPILRHRPDPFASDWAMWKLALTQSYQLGLSRVASGIQHALPKRFRRRVKPPPTPTSPSTTTKPLLHTDDKLPDDTSLLPHQWLEADTFHRLTSHHPLVSPSSHISSSFVRSVFKLLNTNETKLLVHVGTAEWFYDPTVRFARAAKRAGVDVSVYEELGGFHSGPCAFPAELGGASGRLVGSILRWLGEKAW